MYVILCYSSGIFGYIIKRVGDEQVVQKKKLILLEAFSKATALAHSCFASQRSHSVSNDQHPHNWIYGRIYAGRSYLVGRIRCNQHPGQRSIYRTPLKHTQMRSHYPVGTGFLPSVCQLHSSHTRFRITAGCHSHRDSLWISHSQVFAAISNVQWTAFN